MFLNWLSGALVGVGGCGFIGYEELALTLFENGEDDDPMLCHRIAEACSITYHAILYHNIIVYNMI